MTLVTSLFNKGIYKNTLHRFKWGAFIYFLFLFFAVPFTYMVRTPFELSIDSNAFNGINIFFSRGSFVFPLFLAIVVPTVVALLAYNYMHSGRHSIFVHSSPVTRTANYFSTLLASFTLMLLPVVANGVILLAMRIWGYAEIFSISDVLYWIWVNVFVIFIMFSIATFASFLTGNSFAQVGINAILHGLFPLFALAIIIFSDVFIYGYMTAEADFAEWLIEYTPIVWLTNAFSDTDRFSEVFKEPAAWIYFALAMAFYIITAVLCKKRRVENCGEVAGFRIMKPILKYTITAVVGIASFGILINSGVQHVLVWLVSALMCFVAYFACEMILNKTFKVFYAYKGYLGFVAASAAVVCFFAFTSVFGFESRIPDYNEIESATIYSYYNNEIPYSSDDASKEVVRKFHKDFIEDVPVFSSEYQGRTNIYEYNTHVYVAYNLKNGKTIKRRYILPVETCNTAISAMFEFKDYKLAFTGLDRLNFDNVINIPLNIDMPKFHYSYALNEDAKGLLKAIEKDMESISYEEYNESQPVELRLSIDISPEENEKLKIFKPHKDNEKYYYSFYFLFNNNYKNAISFLEERGYMQLIEDRMSESVYVTKTPFVKMTGDDKEVTVMDDGKMVSKEETISVSPDAWVKLEKDDAALIVKQLLSNELVSYIDIKPGDNYLVLVADDINNVYFGNQTIAIPSGEIPEYMKKYVD